MRTVIKVDKLSKAYQLGTFGTGTISRDLERYWAKIRGNDDPFLKIGEENDRSVKGESDIVWSLNNINFEVEQGDAIGIIGRNGAGKSTLLKILSRVTSPTSGSVKVRGRIASLLEVGTGFHPELSGKENIYLNGSILGMRKKEITRQLDAIVDFAGVERYIDTPVKRYSSGMYVRLAFAVAAHLESEILIVDEVLAVGDAEFQKKCLGKMGQVSKSEGRTVLFVSHNMAAIRAICSKGIVLKNGELGYFGSVGGAINYYSTKLDVSKNSFAYSVNHVSSKLQVKNILFNDVNIEEIILGPENDFSFKIKVEIELKEQVSLAVECRFYDEFSTPLAFFSPGHYYGPTQFKGNVEICYNIQFPENLNRNSLIMDLYLTDPGKEIYVVAEKILTIHHQGISMLNGHTFDYRNGAGLLFLQPN